MEGYANEREHAIGHGAEKVAADAIDGLFVSAQFTAGGFVCQQARSADATNTQTLTQTQR